MGGLDIVARNKEGKIKQDYHVSRDIKKGKIIEKNTLKAIEEKELIKTPEKKK